MTQTLNETQAEIGFDMTARPPAEPATGRPANATRETR
jgi:hypothetical protein